MRQRPRKLMWQFIVGVLIGMMITSATGFGFYHWVVAPRHKAAEAKIQLSYQRQLDQMRADQQKLKNTLAQQNASLNDLDTNIDTPTATPIVSVLKQSNVIGSFLIIKNGKVIYNGGNGYADKKAARKNDANTMFQIGSIQKGVTAVTLMSLVESGKVSLSDPISKYISGIKGGQAITLRMMLDMRSGLSLNDIQKMPMSDPEIITWSVKHLKYSFPGKLSYQPVNYVLLAGVIEKVTGIAYSTVVQQKLINPLRLSRTGFMPGLLKEKTFATGYTGSIDSPYLSIYKEDEVVYNREFGTGNMYMTPGDLYRLLNGIDQGKVISTRSLSNLRDQNNGGYTAGVYQFGSYYVTHGEIAAHDVATAMSNDDKNAVIVMSNHSSRFIDLRKIVQKLYLQLSTGG